MVAGALSMAAGEYVSVYSQADTEKADLKLEEAELIRNPDDELAELASIYEKRGLEPALALEVAKQLTEKDALGAHARDELGITEIAAANPLQAAWSSAAAFAAGASAPLVTAFFASGAYMVWLVSAISLFALAVLGGVAAQAGGASIVRGAMRVTFWGAFAMGATGLIGHLFGVNV
ncbi:hypothetical protein GCM10007047_09750 [Cerasicoccus arenae]|uniref:VIT family protein n=2 Tax=Cerasicoccus arenae TaxID=424488 RepID=A0A8J3DA67_9BACT|nr:hypothetical protein GCM10007047_09750 [Cerasicoccus arenae]